MSSWAMVAIVAIIVWGIVQSSKARSRRGKDSVNHDEQVSGQNAAEARREIEDLRERIKVLERIATDGNSLDAQETKRIAAEIEALREKQAD
ncbi:MAG: hypothetical protein ACM308_01210 [Qipengyuania vulgaris]